MEREAEGLFAEIEAQGGVVPAIEKGWFQRQIAASASRMQDEIDTGRRPVVGVNAFEEAEEAKPLDILRIGDEADELQRARLGQLRATRDTSRVERALEELNRAAAEDRNVIPAMLDCARAYATLFEIRHALERVYGAYREPVFF
jgi:methylmalonyl-CoA mutase N-terminal domain/subunit